MKNKLNTEEQFLRDKLNQAEAGFNYQESDWQELQQKLPKKGPFGNYRTLVRAGLGFAILVATAYLINSGWNQAEPKGIAQKHTKSEVTATIQDTEKTPENEQKTQTTTLPQEPASMKAGDEKEENTPKAETKKHIVENKRKAEKEPKNKQTPLAATKIDSNQTVEKEKKASNLNLKAINIDGKACIGNILKLSAAISGNDLSAIKFKWKINGVEQKTTASNFDYQIEETGPLKIVLTAFKNNKTKTSVGANLLIPDVVEINFTYRDMESPFDDYSAEFTATPVSLNNLKWEVNELNTTLEGNSASFDFGKKGVFDVTLIHTYKNGCTTKVSKPVAVDQDFKMLAPDAFTPNGNELNETFIPVGFTPEAGIIENEEFRMSIYDYNGKLVYTTTSNREPWNGRLNNNGNVLAKGSYVWKIELKNSNGQEANYAGKVRIMNK